MSKYIKQVSLLDEIIVDNFAGGCGGDDPEFEVDADDVLQAYAELIK